MIDQAGTADVEEPGTRLYQPDPPAIQQIAALGGKRCGKHDEIGAGQHAVQLGDRNRSFDSRVSGSAAAHAGDPQSETLGGIRDRRAHRAEADDQHALPAIPDVKIWSQCAFR